MIGQDRSFDGFEEDRKLSVSGISSVGYFHAAAV